MIRLGVIATILLTALTSPTGYAAGQTDTFSETFKSVCLGNTGSVEQRIDMAKRAGFVEADVPKGGVFARSIVLARRIDESEWLLILGSKEMLAENGGPPRSEISCIVGGPVGAGVSSLEGWLGFKPHTDARGKSLYAFELVDGRPVGVDGSDPAAVDVALRRNGYFTVHIGGVLDGQTMAVSTFTRLADKP